MTELEMWGLLNRCYDAMEQVLDHVTDGDASGIAADFRVGETIDQRERLVYLPLNELDGIRMAILEIRYRVEAQARAVQSPDIDKCPGCGGPADNGHDRFYPPNPYYCSRCSDGLK